jgi:hypothetical protein
MRPKERIPIFLKYINFDFLQERWNTDISQELRGIVFTDEVLKYWEKNYDMRFGQVLINLQLLPDKLPIWIDEESAILDAQGTPKRETMLWGNNYDKDMNLLPKTIWRPIAEMSTDHIQAILDGGWVDKNPNYRQVFEEEIELRNNE